MEKQPTGVPDFSEGSPGPSGNEKDASNFLPNHVILFTGHMIDRKDRAVPRFPAAMETIARAAIEKALQQEKENIAGPTVAIAGGACGGDILFHEVCASLGIPTTVHLALPKEEFINESVRFAGADWVERFNCLVATLPTLVLDPTNPSLQNKNDSVWVQANLWMLERALANGGAHMTLIALWDGKGGDGIGGTGHMVQIAKEKKARVVWINTGELFRIRS